MISYIAFGLPRLLAFIPKVVLVSNLALRFVPERSLSLPRSSRWIHFSEPWIQAPILNPVACILVLEFCAKYAQVLGPVGSEGVIRHHTITAGKHGPAHDGLRIEGGLRIASGLGWRADCMITD